jgi:hypothetical protein
VNAVTYISKIMFEAERPNPDGSGPESFWIPANAVLTAVDVPQPSVKAAVTTAHRVRFRYDGGECSASLSDFLDVGMCYGHRRGSAVG